MLCNLEAKYFLIPSYLVFADWEVVNSPFIDFIRLAVQGYCYLFVFCMNTCFFVAFTLNSLFHKRNPNSHLMTCKETSLGSKKTTPRRTEKAKRRETEVLKEKAKANERARAGKDQGRRNMKRRVFRRKASSVCPQQRPGMAFFSPQWCLTLRKPWKQQSPPKPSTKPSWRRPHSRLTLQLKPPPWCPVHCQKGRIPGR